MLPEECKEYFKKDIFASETTGIEILEVEEGYARTKLTVQPGHLNANNVVMGGCIYTLVDFTFAIAANCGPKSCVTLSSNIIFNSPATGRELYARTETIKDGRSVSSLMVKVTDEKDRLIATATMMGYKS